MLTFSGSWEKISAGGSLKYASWRYNPQLFLRTPNPCKVKITLQQEHEKEGSLWDIGLYVSKTDGSGYRVISLSSSDLLNQPLFSRSKSIECTIEVTDVSAPLVIIPCTAKPDQECNFRLIFESSDPAISVVPLDPELQYRMYTQVGKWEQGNAGGNKNHATVCDNPQFSVELEKATTVTVTLSQTQKDPFDMIGLYVCKSKVGSTISATAQDLGPGLSPVVRSKSDKPTSAAVRLKTISSKQVVAKSDFSSCLEASVSFKANPKYVYIILAVTAEPNQESSFSLTCFSKRRIKLKSLSQSGVSEIVVDGQWHDESAGGCVNYPTWRNNPQYLVYAKRPFTTVIITLTQKKVFEPNAIGIYVARTTDNAQSRLLVLGSDNLVGKSSFEKVSSVSLTVVLEDTESPYCVIPTTFFPDQSCKFSLQFRVVAVKGAKEGAVFRASTVLNVLPCTFLWNQRTVKSQWTDKTSGGCRNHASWLQNPQVSLKLGQDSKIVVILTVEDAKDSVGLYILKDSRTINQNHRVLESEVSQIEIVAKSVFRKDQEIALEAALGKGVYKIIPATFSPGVLKPFELSLYSDTQKFSSNLCHEQHVTLESGGSIGSCQLDMNLLSVSDVMLGQGGFGVVYKGKYGSKEVAVKKLLVELMEVTDLQTLRKEVAIMSNYSHPNIVAFVGANLAEPCVCIVTELCGKGNLSKVLKLEKDLQWVVKLRISVQISTGMAYLHEQNVVHRDLKSLNILITDDYSAKLCDFGLSKTTSGSSLNSCIGSLNWCAPEVLLKNEPFGRSADVFSFGMILLELYTHTPPFSDMLPLQIVKAIDSGSLLPIPSSCPRAFSMLIKRCWDYTPKNRPSFVEIEKELSKISPTAFPRK